SVIALLNSSSSATKKSSTSCRSSTASMPSNNCWATTLMRMTAIGSRATSSRCSSRLVLRRHRHLDRHAEKIRGGAEIASRNWNGLGRIARHRDTDQILSGDENVGWVVFDPAGARQIDLGPRVGRRNGLRRVAAVERRIVEIPADEACAETEIASGLDEHH